VTEPDSVASTVARVQDGSLSAKEAVAGALDRIDKIEPALCAFTDITRTRAVREASTVDKAGAAGTPFGRLAGVPYAVKSLFDVEGVTTLAGSRINAGNPPASQDATLVARLKAAGACLVGSLNMDEYAYGFTTENTNYGWTRNPHDPERVAGGSSGGSAAAVAAALVPVSLGSDTNGSIRVPASLCGVFGLKPTFGRLSRAGTFPFSNSLDHVGLLARSVTDLALVYDELQGSDPRDPACAPRASQAVAPEIGVGAGDQRIAVVGGYFAEGCGSAAAVAVRAAAAALGTTRTVEIPEAGRARAAAAIVTAVEAASLHLDNLRTRAHEFDPRTRDRFLAGALVPGAWYIQALRFRHWFRARVDALFQQVDILIAPATPIPAPRGGEKVMVVGGVEVAVGAHLGRYTQPISFIGLPVIAVPIPEAGPLPIGVQIIGPPWREDLCFRAAAALEASGAAAAPPIPATASQN